MSKIKELESEILRHKALYYQGRPEISDADYDKLEDDLKKVAPHSQVLNLVGSITSNQDKVKHSPKMLSLAKTYSLEELKKWVGKRKVVSVQKIDGVSCSLVYRKGQLEVAKTRGDGTFGENITSKIQWISSVPKETQMADDFEVRGELYCDSESFIKLAQEMEKLGLDAPTSQRNIVAGLVGRKDKIELCRYLKFFAFDYLNKKNPEKSEEDKHKLLAKMGFELPVKNSHQAFSTLEKAIAETQEFIVEGNYLIDGLVISYNDTKIHQEMGSTSHHPRYRIAFKFQGLSKQTKIENIEWNVSRNGVLTPVANVKPVELSNAIISRVTLHNYGMVKQFKLKPGDEIEIVRSGEVIPKFLQVVKSSNEKYSVPKKCPSCNTKLTEELIRLRCENPDCPQKQKDTILNFIQKIGIDDLSGRRLEEMLEHGLIKIIPDLYALTVEQLLQLDKVKDKLANKIVGNIQKSKQVDLTTFLSALGIAGGAYNKCEKVVEHGFNSLEKIKQLTVEQLVEVESFAEKSATEFINSLKQKSKIIKGLEGHGFKFEATAQTSKQAGGSLTGKKFVITGTLSSKRSDVEKLIKQNGGSVSGSVSKATDFLVTNDEESSSSKFKKAQQLSIPIISEEKLQKLIQGK